jgi:RecQ family ATP-dependent DNA helicase
MGRLENAFSKLAITPTDFQWAAAATIVERDEDLLGVAPTGSGKSECYLSAALALQPKVTVIVSPLLALIRDQARRCERYGIPAVAVHGAVTPKQRANAIEWIADGQAAVVISTPETLRNKRDLTSALERRGVALLAVDEAHVIQDWGDSFRPAYAWLSSISRLIRPRRVAIFSATLTADAALLAVRSIGRWRWTALALPAARPNLHFAIEPYVEKSRENAATLAALWTGRAKAPSGIEVAGQRAIVYGRSVRFVETTADTLRKKIGPNAVIAYHAELRKTARAAAEKEFVQGDPRMLVATTAFGMGVDVPDVRLVAHGQLPPSVVEYLQEAGRGGRDGKPALCMLFADTKASTAEFFVRQTFPGLEMIRRVARTLEGLLPNGEERSVSAAAIAEAAGEDVDVAVARAALGWLDSSGLVRKRPAAKIWVMDVLAEPSGRAPAQTALIAAIRKAGRPMLAEVGVERYEVTPWALEKVMKTWRQAMGGARKARVLKTSRPPAASRLQVVPHEFDRDFNPARLFAARERAQARLREMRAYLEVPEGERGAYLQRAVGLEVERLHELICSEVPGGEVRVITLTTAEKAPGDAWEGQGHNDAAFEAATEVRGVENAATASGGALARVEDFEVANEPVEEVEEGTMDEVRTCHAKGCNVPIPPKSVMCGRHWDMVPWGLKCGVSREYRPGSDQSQAYLEGIRVAVEFIAKAETEVDELGLGGESDPYEVSLGG